MADDNRGWHGDSKGHSEAGSQSSGNQGNPQQHSDAGKGQKGGQALTQDTDQEYTDQQTTNPGNFANRPEDEVEDAARKGGQS